MADSKISDLTALGTTPANDDVLAIVDTDASQTKKVSYTNLGVPANTTHRSSDGKNHSDVVLNNTHRSSDGSDHTFIDQDVTSGSAPTFTADNLSDGGSNAIITTTQETNFEAAYTHSTGDGSDHADVATNTSDITSLKEHTLYLPPINGGGFAITTGMKGYWVAPFACTITGVGILTDQSSTTTVDLWKTTYANYDAGATHPVDGDSITAAAPIGTSAGVKNLDTTLTGWTTAVAEGDIIAINIDANDNATYVYLFFQVTRT